MKKLFAAAFAFAAFGLLAQQASAQDVVRIGTEGAYPPFNYIDENGDLQGFDVDIANALCDAAGFTCEFVVQDWDGIIPGLLAKKYDAIIASMSITAERKEVVAFTDKYYNTPAKFIAAEDFMTEIPVDTAAANAALSGMKVGVQRATIHENFIKDNFPDVELKSYATQDEANLDLANGRVDALATARAFDAWMRAKPVDIGNTVRRNLISWRRSGEPEAPPSEHDAGNGAAMRVLPLALATYGHPPDEIVAASRAQAHVTHNNELSDAACETLVAMLHAYLADDPAAAKRCIASLVENRPQYAHDRKRCENPSGYVVDTLHAVFQALTAHNDFEACLIDVVNRGGDADTTGAIAGMLAGARGGLEAIPLRWLRALDPQVRSQCETQAVALMMRVARRHA